MVKGIFDTHCHLADPLLKDETTSLLENARLKNISDICNVAYNSETIKKVMLQSYKLLRVHPAIGIHPNDVLEFETNKISIKELENFILTNRVKAIGEIGLDYYRQVTPIKIQKH
jgi:TatD DNase family protein